MSPEELKQLSALGVRDLQIHATADFNKKHLGKFIDYILYKYAGLKDANDRSKFTTSEALRVINESLTASTVDPIHNYELYEKIGDRVANYAILTYLMQRFPWLNCVSHTRNQIHSAS